MSKRSNKRRDRSRFVPYPLEYQTYHRLRDICPDESYCIVDPKVFSNILPQRFLQKTNAALIMSSTASGSAVFTVNFNRIDVNASGSCIDQHPFIVAYDLGGSTCKAGLIEDSNHHINRTTIYCDPELWTMASGSAVLNHLPIAYLPACKSGLLSELTIPSQNEAYKKALGMLINYRAGE